MRTVLLALATITLVACGAADPEAQAPLDASADVEDLDVSEAGARDSGREARATAEAAGDVTAEHDARDELTLEGSADAGDELELEGSADVDAAELDAYDGPPPLVCVNYPGLGCSGPWPVLCCANSPCTCCNVDCCNYYTCPK